MARGGVSGASGRANWVWGSGEGWVFNCLERQCDIRGHLTLQFLRLGSVIKYHKEKRIIPSLILRTQSSAALEQLEHKEILWMVRKKMVEGSAPSYYCTAVCIIWPTSVRPKHLPLVLL